MLSETLMSDQSILTGYLAPVGFEKDLLGELHFYGKKPVDQLGRLFLVEGNPLSLAFAQDTWFDVKKLSYLSIGDAAQKLRALGPRWSHYSVALHRRGELICEKLPLAKMKRYEFLEKIPSSHIGAFALLSEKELIYSSQTKSPLPFGEIQFVEDKETPPSRAYLKLWELFTLYGLKPQQGWKVIDVGSCPGGWTWVLQTTGCHVVSVDKAPLDPKIAQLPHIEFRQESAFGLRPQHVGELDCFYSDIICYPEKLYELVMRWRESGLVKRFVCTIKFQSETDYVTMEKFKQIPDSQIIHLSCNKHEVTWVSGFEHE